MQSHSSSLVVTRGHLWSLVVTRGLLVVTRAHSYVLLDAIQHASQRGMRVDVQGMRAIHASHASHIK